VFVVAAQIYIIKLRAEPVLELASRAMANLGRSEHCTRVFVARAPPPLLLLLNQLTHDGLDNV